ncbi:hypothetical protein L0244_33405 [bacterium]|nr:hypothetical protein [bacterium]
MNQAFVILSICSFMTCLFHSETFAENLFQKLAVDIQPILQNGCTRIPAKKEGQGDCCYEVPAHLDCTQLGIEKQYGCSPVQEVPSYLGGLSPKVPIVECIFYGKWGEETKDGIRYKGAGMIPVFNKYIVFESSGFKVLNNPSEFKKFFVPIESAEEALSYAAAITGSYPIYRIEIPKGYKREASIIRSTYVELLPGPSSGYKVHLFDYKVGGCGPHHHYAIDYMVTIDGSLKEVERQNIWRNPKEDNLCAD